jgi:bacterioferritin (cytochrome b1)
LAAASRQQGTQAMLKVELKLEQQAIKEYAEAVADIVDDMITVEMLEEQLLDEMRHAKWLKQQLST